MSWAFLRQTPDPVLMNFLTAVLARIAVPILVVTTPFKDIAYHNPLVFTGSPTCAKRSAALAQAWLGIGRPTGVIAYRLEEPSHAQSTIHAFGAYQRARADAERAYLDARGDRDDGLSSILLRPGTSASERHSHIRDARADVAIVAVGDDRGQLTYNSVREFVRHASIDTLILPAEGRYQPG